MNLTKTSSGKTILKLSRLEWIRTGSKHGWLKPTPQDVFGAIHSSISKSNREYSRLIKLMQEDPSIMQKQELTLEDLLPHVKAVGYGSDFDLFSVWQEGQESQGFLNESQANKVLAQSLLSLMKRMPERQEFAPIIASVKAGRPFSVYVSARREQGKQTYLVPHLNGMAMDSIKSEYTGTVMNETGQARPGPAYQIGKGQGKVQTQEEQAQELAEEQQQQAVQQENQSRLHRNVRNEENAEEAANAAGYIAANAALYFYPQRFEGEDSTHHHKWMWVAELVFNPGTGLKVGDKMRAVTWFTPITNISLHEEKENPRTILASKTEIERLCHEFGIYDVYRKMEQHCLSYYESQMRKPAEQRDHPEKIFKVSLISMADKIKKAVVSNGDLATIMASLFGVSRGEAEEFLGEAFDKGYAGMLMAKEAGETD